MIHAIHHRIWYYVLWHCTYIDSRATQCFTSWPGQTSDTRLQICTGSKLCAHQTFGCGLPSKQGIWTQHVQHLQTFTKARSDSKESQGGVVYRSSTVTGYYQCTAIKKYLHWVHAPVQGQWQTDLHHQHSLVPTVSTHGRASSCSFSLKRPSWVKNVWIADKQHLPYKFKPL